MVIARRSRLAPLTLVFAVLGTASSAGAAPANDQFARAKSIAIGSAHQGNLAGATTSRLEPTACVARQTVWYRFAFRDHSTPVTITTSREDISVGLFRGSSLSQLELVGCPGRETGLLRPGTYHIQVGFKETARADSAFELQLRFGTCAQISSAWGCGVHDAVGSRVCVLGVEADACAESRNAPGPSATVSACVHPRRAAGTCVSRRLPP